MPGIKVEDLKAYLKKQIAKWEYVDTLREHPYEDGRVSSYEDVFRKFCGEGERA